MILYSLLHVFQSTLPHGERLELKSFLSVVPMFQSTLPHGERLRKVLIGLGYQLFQSTLPHGERHGHGEYLGSYAGFNPRSHTGSDGLCYFWCSWFECFNPRSHTGSDPYLCYGGFGYKVSIHAPTRGATASLLLNIIIIMFQSTLPHGERRVLAVAKIAIPFVSIHAPTRGAT